MISSASKLGATSLGLNESRIFSHSLKIGGLSVIGDDAFKRKIKFVGHVPWLSVASKRDVSPLTVAS